MISFIFSIQSDVIVDTTGRIGKLLKILFSFLLLSSLFIVDDILICKLYRRNFSMTNIRASTQAVKYPAR